MKKTVLIFCLILLLGVFSSMNANASEWRFPVGLTYVSEFGDVVDLYEDNLEAEGYIVDTGWEFPVGISFQPYLELDNGIRIGTGIGPVAVIAGDASFVDVPLNLNAGYTLFREADVSPYIRGGLVYHIISGDYDEDSEAGFFGGVGIEFLRKKTVGFGIEVGYDSTEIEFERCSSVFSSIGNCVSNGNKEKIKPFGLTASIFAVF